VGKIKSEGHAGGVMLPIITTGEVVGRLQAGFRVQRVTGDGDDGIDVAAVRDNGRIAVAGRRQTGQAVSEGAVKIKSPDGRERGAESESLGVIFSIQNRSTGRDGSKRGRVHGRVGPR